MYEPVSVIVRAYNAEKYIRKALNSILSNTYEGLIEIVVCYDQGSKDRSLDVIKEVISSNSRRKNRIIKLVMHEHTTPFHALLECGFANTTGRFISILDHDNLYPRRHIEKMVKKALETKKNFLFVRDYFFEDETLKIIGASQIPEDPCNIINLIRGNYIDGNAMFIDRSCLYIIMNKLKKLNHRLYDFIFEDWLIALLGLKHCKCLFCSNSYVFYRVHTANLTGINVEDYRTNILTSIRDIATLVAFYELEKDDLSRREIIELEYSLLRRLLTLLKFLGKGMEKGILFNAFSKLVNILRR
jgi:glycosyltransferase involved in cell wall biosynthesis